MTDGDLIGARHRPPRFDGGSNWGAQLRIGMLIDWLDSRPDQAARDLPSLHRRAERGDSEALAAAVLTDRLGRRPHAGELAFTGHNDHALEYGVRYHAQVSAHLDDGELPVGAQLYRRLHQVAPACLSALVNLAEIERRAGRPDLARELLEAARGVAASSEARRYGVADRAWSTSIGCDLARLGDQPGAGGELLENATSTRLRELIDRLRAYGSWDAAALPAHQAFAAASPAQRIALHAAMRLAPIHPQPPPAAHGRFTAIAEVEAMVRTHAASTGS